MTFGSLFAGIGGMDLGLERAGMVCKWQVERDAKCKKVLEKWWPNVSRSDDVKRTGELVRVDLIAGGDPCPSHSKARSIHGSRHPDMSGYFLAVVARLKPRWVVRENVPSPSSVVFSAALESIGYGTAVIDMDAAEITGQSRKREFVVGVLGATWSSVGWRFKNAANASRIASQSRQERPHAACLTTHPCRYDTRDNYIWEQSRGLRILDGDEREQLAGFPRGWTAGFPETARAKFYGNCCVPYKAEWIGRRIMEAAPTEGGAR